MGLSGWERWTLAVTGLCLALMAGRFWHTQRMLPLPGSLPVPEPVYSRQPAGPRINLNTADREQLMELPGIGAERAERIVQYRAAHGPFERLEELLAVEGIGPAVVEELREWATAGGDGYGENSGGG